MAYSYWTVHSKEHGTFYNFRAKTRKDFLKTLHCFRIIPKEGDVVENNTAKKSYILKDGTWKKYPYQNT